MTTRKNYYEKQPLDYYMNGRSRRLLHPDSAKLLEKYLNMLARKGEAYTFRYIHNYEVIPLRRKKLAKYLPIFEIFVSVWRRLLGDKMKVYTFTCAYAVQSVGRLGKDQGAGSACERTWHGCAGNHRPRCDVWRDRNFIRHVRQMESSRSSAVRCMWHPGSRI